MSGAERWEFPLPDYVGVGSFAPPLKVIPDSSAQRPLSAHLKFHSASVKSLHTCSNLKEGAIPDIAPISSVCLLSEILYKLHLSMNDLLEGTCESVWTCACPRLMESGIGARLNHRSGLWIKTCSAFRLYFARSAPRSLRSHTLLREEWYWSAYDYAVSISCTGEHLPENENNDTAVCDHTAAERGVHILWVMMSSVPLTPSEALMWTSMNLHDQIPTVLYSFTSSLMC